MVGRLMASEQPRISIGLPVFNGGKYLEQAINSILAQTFADFELIIVDNASIDNTQEICSRYAARDTRIHYCRNEMNLGLTRNFNRAFELSTGKYFAYMSHDDYLAPQFYAKCLEVLENDPSVVLCHCQATIVDDQNSPVAHYDATQELGNELSPAPHIRFRDLILSRGLCLESYGLMRSDVLRRIKPLYRSHYGSDKNFLAELALSGKLFHVPEVMFFWRDERAKYADYISWMGRFRSWQSWSRRLDTSKPCAVPLGRWSWLKGYVQSVTRVRLSRKERFLSYLVILE